MLAIIKTEKAREVLVREAAPPKLEAHEILIKVEYCGVCGSDLHAFKHAPGYEFVQKPRILGHEIVGKVIDVFNQEDDYLLNRTVIVESIHYCGTCTTCTQGQTHICENIQVIGLHFDGGMADYVKCSSRFIQLVPSELSSQVAVLVEPMAVAVHAMQKAQITRGTEVLVQGPGIIGLFTALACLSKGASVVLAGLPADRLRLQAASQFGIQPYIVGESTFLEGKKVDAIFECSGSPAAFLSGFQYLKKGGQTVVVALYEEEVKLFLTSAVRQEWSITTSYGSQPEDYKTAFYLLDFYQKKLGEVVTYYPVQEAEKAFLDALAQKVLKPILCFEDT